MGNNEIYRWENAIGPFLVHRHPGPTPPPPPPPPPLQQPPAPGSTGCGSQSARIDMATRPTDCPFMPLGPATGPVGSVCPQSPQGWGWGPRDPPAAPPPPCGSAPAELCVLMSVASTHGPWGGGRGLQARHNALSHRLGDAGHMGHLLLSFVFWILGKTSCPCRCVCAVMTWRVAHAVSGPTPCPGPSRGGTVGVGGGVGGQSGSWCSPWGVPEPGVLLRQSTRGGGIGIESASTALMRSWG